MRKWSPEATETALSGKPGLEFQNLNADHWTLLPESKTKLPHSFKQSSSLYANTCTKPILVIGHLAQFQFFYFYQQYHNEYHLS
jgi:hypothetical protein